MNIAIVSEKHSELLMYFDILKKYKPDLFDKANDFIGVSASYDLVYIDHSFKDRTWLDIYRRIPESSKVVVLTTNPLHWYKMEFEETIWKTISPIFQFTGVHHAQKNDFTKIKFYAESLYIFRDLKKIFGSVAYKSDPNAIQH